MGAQAGQRQASQAEAAALGKAAGMVKEQSGFARVGSLATAQSGSMIYSFEYDAKCELQFLGLTKP